MSYEQELVNCNEGRKGLPVEKQSSAKAGGSKSVKAHRAGCLRVGAERESGVPLGCGHGQIARSLLSQRKES